MRGTRTSSSKGKAYGSYMISAAYQRDGVPPTVSIPFPVVGGGGAFSTTLTAAVPAHSVNIQTPTETFWVGENDGNDGGGTRTDELNMVAIYKGAGDRLTFSATPRNNGERNILYSRRGQISSHHLETTNVLFFDDHVKAMKFSQLQENSSINAAYHRYFTSWDD